MNKVTKSVLVVALCAIMMMALVACGGGGGSVANTSWTLDKMTMDGTEVDASMLTGLGMTVELSFTDTEFSMSMMGQSVKGTYTQDGSKIAMTAEGSTIEASISGGKITMEEDGNKVIFKKK